ncbi:MAG: hypothetical protein LBS63_05240 [Prevotellaceae bacterium]|nr:hypothetical protein [Prevotellaceae bacterium]
MLRKVMSAERLLPVMDIPWQTKNVQVEVVVLPLSGRTPAPDAIETHLASEYALAKDWQTPQEDEAWKDL